MIHFKRVIMSSSRNSNKFFPQLKLITFDAKDTIMELVRSPGEHYADVARRQGVHIEQSEEATLTKSFKGAFISVQQEYPSFGKHQRMCLTDWWVEIVSRTFRFSGIGEDRIEPSVMKDIGIIAFKEYATPLCWRVKGDAVEALERIRSVNPEVTVGVISNGDDRLEDLLVLLGLRRLIDFAIDSYSAGSEKPDKEIFDIALRRSKLPVTDSTREALHIGDDVEQDYFAAKRAGWRSLLLLTKTSSSTAASNLVPPSSSSLREIASSQGTSSESSSHSSLPHPSVGKEGTLDADSNPDLILSLTQVIHM
jgi:REG-2-like HAD superfamily hydrolase